MERRPVAPGQHGTGRKKVSEYGTQLREKQKVKRAYGILESQFRKYYEDATKMKGKTGENMLSLLERRLDNVVYRLGIGASRAEARQIVSHGHITVNGNSVNIPSYRLSKGDVVAIKESKRKKEIFKDIRETKVVLPKWLEWNPENMEGKLIALPERADIDLTIAEHLIVEIYSR